MVCHAVINVNYSYIQMVDNISFISDKCLIIIRFWVVLNDFKKCKVIRHSALLHGRL
jgi:hypothetical protein